VNIRASFGYHPAIIPAAVYPSRRRIPMQPNITEVWAPGRWVGLVVGGGWNLNLRGSASWTYRSTKEELKVFLFQLLQHKDTFLFESISCTLNL
jgi:hypothetical protein